MRFPLIVMAVFSGLALVASRATEPATDSFKGLLTNSPFGAQATAAGAGTSAALELRGVFVDQGEPFFSLYETATRTARWVGLNEPGNPFTVRRYDLTLGQITVEYQGREIPLGLKQAKVVALIVPPPAPATGPGPVSMGPGGVPQVAAAAPDEAARMAAIAEEIARRRAMRMRAITPPPAGQVAPRK